MFAGWVPTWSNCATTPAPIFPTDPQPLSEAKMQGSAAATVTFRRLSQMKEGGRIIFCLSCPYLSLAPVCFKLHGRATLQGFGGSRGTRQTNGNVGVLQIIQRLVRWAAALNWWCAILQKDYLRQCITAMTLSFYLVTIFSPKLHFCWQGLLLHKGS